MCALVVGTCSLGSAGSFPYQLLSCALFGPRTRSYGLELSALFACALTFFRCLHLFAASRVVSSIRSRSGFSPGGYLVLGVSFKMPLCSRCLYIRSCISFGLCGSDGFPGLAIVFGGSGLFNPCGSVQFISFVSLCITLPCSFLS